MDPLPAVAPHPLARIVATLVSGDCLAIGAHERLPPCGYCLERGEEYPWVYRLAKRSLA